MEAVCRFLRAVFLVFKGYARSGEIVIVQEDLCSLRKICDHSAEFVIVQEDLCSFSKFSQKNRQKSPSRLHPAWAYYYCWN